jgi:hypothetical protein
MKTIPEKHGEELDLHALRVLDVLFRERSLTRAAEALRTQQPALSKTLARLRRYFDDPLFVRVALHMEPTAKALELVKPVRALLDGMQRLRNEQMHFRPRESNRTFRIFTLDAGVIVLLPTVIKLLGAVGGDDRHRGGNPYKSFTVFCCRNVSRWFWNGSLDRPVLQDIAGRGPGLGLREHRPLHKLSALPSSRMRHCTKVFLLLLAQACRNDVRRATGGAAIETLP